MAQQPTLDELKTAINRFHTDTLKDILENLGGDKNTKASDRLSAVVEIVLEISTQTFTSKLGDLLSGVTKEVKVGKESELRDHINKKSLEKVLGDLSEDTLTAIMKKFGLDETKDKGEMEKQILDETFLNGAKAWLSKLKVSIVRAISADLKVEAKKSQTKDTIVDSLMKEIFNFKDDTAEEKSKSKKSSQSKKRSRSRSASRSRSRSASPARRSSKSSRSRSKRSSSPSKRSSSKSSRSKSPKTAQRGAPRPPTSDIKKGDTYTKLFDTYNASDLVTYCRDHKLPVSGTKKVVIKRILDYLATGVVPDPKDKPKKRKRGGSYPLKPKKKVKKDEDDDKDGDKKDGSEKSEKKEKKKSDSKSKGKGKKKDDKEDSSAKSKESSKEK